MGKNGWFIFIDPLREFVWKGLAWGGLYSRLSPLKTIVLPLCDMKLTQFYAITYEVN